MNKNNLEKKIKNIWAISSLSLFMAGAIISLPSVLVMEYYDPISQKYSHKQESSIHENIQNLPSNQRKNFEYGRNGLKLGIGLMILGMIPLYAGVAKYGMRNFP